MGGHLLHNVPRVGHDGGVGEAGAAAEDGAMEELPVCLSDGGEEEEAGEGGSCSLTQQSHALRVAAKLKNVLLTIQIRYYWPPVCSYVLQLGTMI